MLANETRCEGVTQRPPPRVLPGANFLLVAAIPQASRIGVRTRGAVAALGRVKQPMRGTFCRTKLVHLRCAEAAP